MSTVNVTLKVDDEQQIPFSVSRNVPNAVTLAAMDAAEKDEDMQRPFDSVDALMEALNA
jgi:DNA-damage-inducible protein J